MKLAEIITHLYGQGNTVEQIAERLFKQPGVIRTYLVRAGKLTPSPRAYKKDSQRADLVARLFAESGSTLAVAQKLGLSQATVRKFLKVAGVTLRIGPAPKLKTDTPPRWKKLDVALFLEAAKTELPEALTARFNRSELHLRRVASQHGVALLRRKRRANSDTDINTQRLVLIRQYAAEGYSQREIAKKVGVHEATVSRCRKAYSIPIAENRGNKNLAIGGFMHDKDPAFELARAGSVKKLAKEIGVKSSSVWLWLAMRDIHSTNKGGGGQAEKNRKSESKADLVGRLHAAGQTTDQIAEKTGLSKATVYEYLSRANGKRKPLWKKPKGYKPKTSRKTTE